MIDIATLFKNIIPLETLFKFPKSFVHRLRDIKIEQLQAQQREAQLNMPKDGKLPITNPLVNGTAIEDLIDELS